MFSVNYNSSWVVMYCGNVHRDWNVARSDLGTNEMRLNILSGGSSQRPLQGSLKMK